MARSNVRIVEFKVTEQYKHNFVVGAQLDLLPADKPVDPYEGHWFLAKDEEGRCMGFACLKVLPFKGYGYLARSGVYENARGQGLQARLIRARERKARQLGLTHLVCDTAYDNYASSNSLIRCGYKLYKPIEPWAFLNGMYWIKEL